MHKLNFTTQLQQKLIQGFLQPKKYVLGLKFNEAIHWL